MINCNHADHIEIPHQESYRSYVVDFCTSVVYSSLRLTRMGKNGGARTGKEGTRSEYDCTCDNDM